MSWDVTLHRFPREYSSMDELIDSGDEELLALGKEHEVRAAVDTAFPSTQWDSPLYGVWVSESGVVEFNLGDGQEITALALCVRGDDSSVIGSILSLSARNGWQAIDLQTSQFLRDDAAGESFSSWRSFRDEVLDGYGGDPSAEDRGGTV